MTPRASRLSTPTVPPPTRLAVSASSPTVHDQCVAASSYTHTHAPSGAPNATATPVAAPMVVKSRFHPSVRSGASARPARAPRRRPRSAPDAPCDTPAARMATAWMMGPCLPMTRPPAMAATTPTALTASVRARRKPGTRTPLR